MKKIPLILLALSLQFLYASTSHAEKTTILYLGDSLSMGAFGTTLDSGLRNQGAEVFTVVAGGASPYYWLKAYQSLPSTIGFWEKTPINERRVNYIRAVPKMEDLIEEHSPEIIVVQTGINLYATLRSRRRPKEDNVLEIRSLIDQMSHSISKSGARAYWILPPHSHERRYSLDLQNELAGIMRSVVNEYDGAVFESGQVTKFTDPYPATDGIHYGPTEAAAWATRVTADLSIFVQEHQAEKRNSFVRLNLEETSPEIDIDAEPTMVASTSTSSILPNPAPDLVVPLKPKKAPGAPEASGDTLPAIESMGNEVPIFDRLDLDLRLLSKSRIENISEIDYANALGVYEYEVIKDRMGNYPYDRIRVAHGIVFRRRFTSAAQRELGATIALRLVPLTTYRSLSTWQMVDDLTPNFDMPIYTPKLD